MTRPKRFRQAANEKAYLGDCRDLPLLRRSWAQLTPKYALELAVLDAGPDVYPVQIFWHPHKPADDEILVMASMVNAEVEEILSLAMRHNSLGAAS